MKVRAKEVGQYKGRIYETDAVFEIENGSHYVPAVDDYARPILDKQGKPVMREHGPHLEYWMEEVKEEKKKGWL